MDLPALRFVHIGSLHADDVLERRDSAILLPAFAGAFRRSELSELSCGDVTVNRHDGLHIQLRMSKADQEGRGAVKALPFTDCYETCPPARMSGVGCIQIFAAFDTGGHPSITRLLRKPASFTDHVCDGEFPGPPPAHRC